jgi:hypothetical protein
MPSTNITHLAASQSNLGAFPYTRANQLNVEPNTMANGKATKWIFSRRPGVSVILQ